MARTYVPPRFIPGDDLDVSRWEPGYFVGEEFDYTADWPTVDLGFGGDDLEPRRAAMVSDGTPLYVQNEDGGRERNPDTVENFSRVTGADGKTYYAVHAPVFSSGKGPTETPVTRYLSEAQYNQMAGGGFSGVLKDMLTSPIGQFAAAVLLPGLGGSLGSALGASPALGNALIRGALSEATGGDFIKGALTAGAVSALGGIVAPEIAAATGSNAIAGALTGGALAELQGGNFLQGAVQGGISGAINDAKLALADEYINSVEPGIPYDTATLPTELDVIAAAPELDPTLAASFIVPEIYQPTVQDVVSALEQPIVQQPSYQEPTIQEIINAIEQPTYQEPVYQEPIYQEPIYQEPVYQEPVYQEQTVPTVEQQAPLIQDLLDQLAGNEQVPEIVITAPRIEQPVVESPPVFQADYSLSTGSPTLPDMGAQGVQVPTINEIIDVVNQPVDYNLPVPDSGIGLQMPTVPNLDAMGGGQGITVPVDGGTLTEAGVIPDVFVPDLGGPDSFINQPAPNVTANIPDLPAEPPKNIDTELGLLNAAQSLVPLIVGSLANQSQQPAQTPTGFDIVPIPGDWRSPEYSQTFTPSAAIDFGSLGQFTRQTPTAAPSFYNLSDVINTLNFQSVPFAQQQLQMPQQTFEIPDILRQFQTPSSMGMDGIIGEIDGTPMSLNSIIAGIQSQYG